MMPPSVLILSCPQDTHAHAMCEALERKGARSHLLYTPDFPEKNCLSIRLEKQGPTLASRGPKLMDLGPVFRSVWLRRPYAARISEEFDEVDRKIIRHECRTMRLSFFDLLCPSAFWVNPFRTYLTEHFKPTQLVTAQQCGFRIPETLVSNDPDEIAAFVEQARGPVVYKAFGSLVPTSILNDDLLSDVELFRWTPGIFQHYVNKDHELRVTVIGRRLFTVRINSQQTSRGKIDWREAQLHSRGETSDLVLESASLPKSTQRACLRLVKALGLAFGAIDLIVTPEGETVFLEINPSGQFLWIDHQTDLPLLDALSEMLIQGRIDFQWDRRSPAVRFDSEFLEIAEARQGQSMAEHVCELQT